MTRFQGKLAVLQRVLPAYRAPFFDLLAQQCARGLALAAGPALPIESIHSAEKLAYAQLTRVRNRHFFHPRHPFYLCIQSGLIDWLESEDPDVLVVEANPRYPATQKAVRWMHSLGKPVLGWGLGAPPISGPLAGPRIASRNRFLRTLNGIIAYSQHGALEYARLGIFPGNNIFTAPNAVTPPPLHDAPVRGPLNPPLSLLFVGRLQARKRLGLLFDACNRLPEHIQPAVTIVGDGPDRALFETKARAYPKATFTGELHGSELTHEFEKADLFVLPGTGGLAVQEAMSYALPVIVAEGDGSQNDLVREENGWLVPAGDPDALFRCLESALSDPDLRKKGLAGRRIVSQEINLHIMADRFLDAVNSIQREI